TALLKVYNKTKHPNATADVIPELRKVVFNDSDVSASYTPKQKEVRGVSEMDARNLVKNISLNKDIAIQLQPKADLLNLAKDFSNVIKTPIFDSKISIDKLLNHLADKTEADKRLEYLNLIKPTLENPLFITRENNRYRFVKTFIDSDKITKFLSVIENDKGEFIGITATPIKNTDLKNLLKGNIVWGGDTLSTLSTPQIAKQEVEAMNKTISNQSLKKAQVEQKSKQYAKFLAEANEPTQDAPNELYKAYTKAKKDIEKPTKKINKDKEKKMAEVLNLDTNKLISDYKQIEASIVSENSIFDKAIKYLNDSFNDKTLAPKDKITIQSNLMSAMAINLTAKALETALNWQQINSQLDLSKQELALKKEQTNSQLDLSKQELELKKEQTNSQKLLSNAEIEFNKARTELVKAQTSTEKQKNAAVIREIASYDDQLRTKEAEIITNAVFGYASGGVAVPQDLSERMITTIDKITPNS
ncbi:PBECR2 nuclease fold domain-containing protein, partial [Campylobacter porcelli]|uniref:PBECR2 nuclease fold domain-containing protein n=3 Tax=Campylobacter TaxID=194 RepID=UPI0015D89A56